MSEHGAVLQTYNQELVKCLEDLKLKRSEVQRCINKEELEKAQIEKQVKILLDKLAAVNKNLTDHMVIRDGYDRTIKETENGFKKILESSQVLLNLIQHEANRLDVGVYQKNNTNIHLEYNINTND